MHNSRKQGGAFNVLFQKHLSENEKLFQKYQRLPPQLFIHYWMKLNRTSRFSRQIETSDTPTAMHDFDVSVIYL